MSILHRKTVKIVFGSTVFVFLIGYGLFQARFLIQGPIIDIASPQNGATLEAAVVDIEGSTSNITSIELNNRKIYVNEQGKFKEQVILSQGYNVVTVEASDRFGRTTTNAVKIIHQPEADNDQISRHPRFTEEKEDVSS